MLKDRLFYVIVTMALLVMAALVITQSAATAKVVSDVAGQAASTSIQAGTAACPFSAQDVQSMRSEQVKDTGLWLPRTDRGFTGLEGGVLSLLNCLPENNQ